MTLRRFQQLLKKANPKLRLKVRGYGDIVGLYGSYHYILRMTKGELHLNGHRLGLPNPDDPTKPVQGMIQKRGRKTIINILRNHRWITNHRQRTMLLWGIEPKEI